MFRLRRPTAPAGFETTDTDEQQPLYLAGGYNANSSEN
jgi:hypothetical protein